MSAFATKRELHHRDDDFMFKPCLGNALAGINEVVYIIQRIEVTDAGHAVLLEHLGMEIDHIIGLRSECHHIDTAGKSLQTGFRSDSLAEFVHHIKGVFAAVLIQGLEACAATGFKMRDSRCCSRFDCRHEVFCKDPGAKDGLETIAERSILKENFFHICSHGRILLPV